MPRDVQVLDLGVHLVCLVDLVCLVGFVDLVHLVHLIRLVCLVCLVERGFKTTQRAACGYERQLLRSSRHSPLGAPAQGGGIAPGVFE